MLRSIISNICCKCYAFNSILTRRFIRKAINYLESGQYSSKNLRVIMERYHKVKIGFGSYGSCFDPEKTYPNVEVGKYTSIASFAYFYTRNHSTNFVSTYPMFYNAQLGAVKEDVIENTKLIIGNDVWIGQHAVVVPSCNYIGNGAVIAAGAIVTKDVPPYAVVGGVPAKILRYRFSKEIIEELEQIKWWDWNYDFIKNNYSKFHNIEEFLKFANTKK